MGSPGSRAGACGERAPGPTVLARRPLGHLLAPASVVLLTCGFRAHRVSLPRRVRYPSRCACDADRQHETSVKRCSRSSTTSTATCRRSRPCWPTPGPPRRTGSCSAATTRSSAPGRGRRSSACASSTPTGSAATASAGPRRRTRRRTPVQGAIARCRELLGEELVAELGVLTETLADGDTLYCHGSPNSDVASFMPEPAEEDPELLEGVTASATRLRPHPPRLRPHGPRTGSSWSTRAASGCRSTATTAPPTRSSTTAARSSTGGSSTTSRRSADAVRERRSGRPAEIPARRIERASLRRRLTAAARTHAC